MSDETQAVENLPDNEPVKPESTVEATAVAPSDTAEQIDIGTPESAPPVETAENAAEPAASAESAADRQELIEELDELLDRMKKVSPGYTPPPYSPRGLTQLLREYSARFSPTGEEGLVAKLRSGPAGDLFNLDTWKGVWYMLNYTVDYQKERVVRRVKGEYETDEWGYDAEVAEAVLPFFQFLYKRYWRVTVSGIENVPLEGRALLVSNHSGQLPFDGSMVGLAVQNEHPNARLVRTMYARWFTTLPFISTALIKTGQILAQEENGVRMLEQDQLVAVYPEGIKGLGKLYKDRYQLAEFGHGGFVRMALKAGAPMIPVAVVGAEETYISVGKSDFIARLFGLPYFPVTTTWPWLGLLGAIPIPTKWTIDFGEPVPTDQYSPDEAANPELVAQLTDQMRSTIQGMVNTRLAGRKSVLFG